MDYSTATIPPMTLAGISTKTSYDNSTQDIPLFWDKFNQQEIIDTISNKISNDVYAVYYDYESDFKGSYHFFIGCLVNIEDGAKPFEILKIPEQKYAIFPVKGDFPKSLIDTWQSIWESDIDRKYTFDFEKYNNFKADSLGLEVYIALD